jgi:tetratricopeptide (TPR) repeat protein
MGHYRVITGYDDGAQSLTMQDSYYGGNRPLAYATFESEWRPFNGAAVLGYRPEQAAAVSDALGALADDAQRLQAALQLQTAQAQAGGDALAWFALAELRSRAGDHGGAVEAAERAFSMGLPPRATWYQFGPYRSYFETGQLERLLALTDHTLAFMGGKNLEESHYWRGMALRGLGREDEARASFTAALQFHPGYAPAEQALGGP